MKTAIRTKQKKLVTTSRFQRLKELVGPLVSLVGICTLVGLAAPRSSGAQALGEPNAQRFYVSPTRAFLGVDGAEVRGNGRFSFSLFGDYASRPFTIDSIECETSGGVCSGRKHAIVESAYTAQLTLQVALFDRLAIGVNVPFVAYANGNPYSYGVGADRRVIEAGSATTLGDPRLHLVLNLVSGSGVDLALVAYGTAPLAQAMAPRRYMGDSGFTGGGHLAFSWNIGLLTFGLNLGGTYRDSQTLVRSQRGPEMTWGAAVGFRPASWLGLLVEAQGATTFGSIYDNEAPTELRGALNLRAGEVEFTGGAGAGLVYAIGVPEARVFFGVAYVGATGKDSDGDGILDELDGCPSVPEDRDGTNDDDGCPDLDNDEDGVLDGSDRCPTESEDRDGFEDEDGCIDPDNDHDGVLDGYDSCPNQAEDVDGDADEDGCPDNDQDHDGVIDDLDRCPNEAEDTDGLEDEDGCPETDVDHDGIPDDRDQCPEQPEDRDRFEDTDGCPEEGGPGVGGRATTGGRRRRSR